MPNVRIGNVDVTYQVYGTGPRVVLTQGGRFGMDARGVRELACELADDGFQVLTWDPPNSGRSSVVFDADSELALWSETLIDLVVATNFTPTALIGGCEGSRVSLMAAAERPDLVDGLYVWWISGGTYGLMSLGTHRVAESLWAATRWDMSAVARLTTWRASIAANPDNASRILTMDRERFIETMRSWMNHFLPSPNSPVPGMCEADFAALSMPVSILRNGTFDLHHPRSTSDWVHRLIPGSRLADPPWGDDEWNERTDAMRAGGSLLERWPLLAPDVGRFLRDHCRTARNGQHDDDPKLIYAQEGKGEHDDDRTVPDGATADQIAVTVVDADVQPMLVDTGTFTSYAPRQ